MTAGRETAPEATGAVGAQQTTDQQQREYSAKALPEGLPEGFPEALRERFPKGLPKHFKTPEERWLWVELIQTYGPRNPKKGTLRLRLTDPRAKREYAEVDARTVIDGCIVIARHVNKKHGTAWPTLETIAEASRTAPGTIGPALRLAEELGWLQRRPLNRPHGKDWKYIAYMLSIPDWLRQSCVSH